MGSVKMEARAAAVAEPRTEPRLLQSARSGGQPKVGCVSWCFHSFAGGADPEEALDIIGDIGFEGTDLILLAREDIDAFWTGTRIDGFRRQLERNRLELAQFVLFQPVVEGLTSPDREERERNLDYFEAGCRIGRKLGAPLVNIVAPWARELSHPRIGYLPRYYELRNPQPGEKFHIDLAPGFDWDQLWDDHIAATRACLERAKAHGMKLTIEHHTHTMIPDATSFLRLWDAIGDPALGYNMDIGWTLSQREYPPVAIHKVKRQLMNLHTRDIDGLMREFVHVGEGVMDFQAVAETLKAIGFQGFLSIEQDKHPGDMRATCARYLAMMKEYLE
jgi:sugar phosphate isomerase/epimerase